MSSNPTFHSTLLQVPEGNVRKRTENERLKKSKYSKSSGSVSKSVVCSSCDEGDVSEEDGDKRRGATGSDPSSTNVIFFKDITDSSVGSMEEHRRSILHPGKRKSFSSKLALSKKVKETENSETMLCETHRKLRLVKAAGMRITPQRRPSSQKWEREGRVGSPRPCTAGGIEDTEKKYSDSIFGVFVKPETRMVRKRLVPMEKMTSRSLRFSTDKQFRTTSKNRLEQKRVGKRKSPPALVEPKEKNETASASKSHEVHSEKQMKLERKVEDEIEDKEGRLVEESTEVVISVDRSKSTLKSPKPVSSKRSVHWEDQVENTKKKGNSSQEAKSLAFSDPTKGYWQMECAKRACRIRRYYEKLRKNSLTTKEDIHMELTAEKTSLKLKRKIPMKNIIHQNGTELVQTLESKSKLTKRLVMGEQNIHNEEMTSVQNKESPNSRTAENEKIYSSSESEIHRKHPRNSYTEISEEDNSRQQQINTEAQNRKGRCMCKESDADTSGISGEDEFDSLTGRRRKRRGKRAKDMGRIIPRRTSSPAICKSVDSKSTLFRRKSSPGVNRKVKTEPSESTLSCTTYRSETSAKDTDLFNKGYPRDVSIHDKHPVPKEYSKEDVLKAADRHININRRTKSLITGQAWLKQTSNEQTHEDALFSFKECLKETEECLEKIKTSTTDKSEIIHEILEKLSKIRHKVGINNSELHKKSKNTQNEPCLKKSKPRAGMTIKVEKKKDLLSDDSRKMKVGEHKERSGSARNRLGPTSIESKQSERSKEILESWGSTEKSIGERSQRLLRNIRNLRERRGTRRDSTYVASDKMDSKCETSLLGQSSINSSEGKTFSSYDKRETKKFVDINSCSDILEGSLEEPKGNINIVSASNNTSDAPVEHVVDGENTSESTKTEILNETHSLKVILSDTTHSVENVYHAMSEKFLIESQQKGELNNDKHFTGSENPCNKFVLINPPQRAHSLDVSNNIKQDGDSDSSCPSLENVTTASIESLATEDNQDEMENTIPSERSSRSSSRYMKSFVPRSRGSSAGTSGRSWRRDELPERPPSRKPYFTQNSSDSDGNSPTRVTSSPERSYNLSSVSKPTHQNTSHQIEAKKPPPSRMYSTLKETPFNAKESIKSVIEDLSSTPNSIEKKPNVSAPSSAKTSPVTSHHKMSSGAVKTRSRSITAVSEPKTSGTTVSSRISPGSLRILKQRAKINRELNDKNRPSTAGVNNCRLSSQDSRPTYRSLDRQTYLKKRISSLSKPSTPLLGDDSKKSKLKPPTKAERTKIQAIFKKPDISSVLKSSKLGQDIKDNGVTFGNFAPKEEGRSKPQSPETKKKLLLSQRLPNYKPPWERVDLRPPESALAERAMHEKRLFGEERRQRSRQSSVSSRPQTPKTPLHKAKDFNTIERRVTDPWTQEGRDGMPKTVAARGKPRKTPEERGKEGKAVTATREREWKAHKAKGNDPKTGDIKSNTQVKNTEEENKGASKRRCTTPKTVREKGKEEQRHVRIRERLDGDSLSGKEFELRHS